MFSLWKAARDMNIVGSVKQFWISTRSDMPIAVDNTGFLHLTTDCIGWTHSSQNRRAGKLKIYDDGDRILTEVNEATCSSLSYIACFL